MEHQLWKAIVAVLATFDKPRNSPSFEFSDEVIVKVFYWAVVHDRPISWAVKRIHWPIHLRKRSLPSSTTMSRRLRTASVRTLLTAMEQRVVAPQQPGLFWMIDGKPLSISGCSKDKQAGYGRAANCKAKGYKIHAIVGNDGAIASWRVAPMNKDERVMAERMVRTAPIQGYLVADSNYDSNKLHEACRKRDQLQLVTRRRYGSDHGTGHRKQSSGRLRAIELTENPNPAFADNLLRDRNEIERRFANLTNWGGGLTCLPPWVRRYRRVQRWVQAKLVLAALKRAGCSRTYVA
jgi:hypothetical protein